ncbi:29727_t:CDS:1, partial [Racocetra persica]
FSTAEPRLDPSSEIKMFIDDLNNYNKLVKQIEFTKNIRGILLDKLVISHQAAILMGLQSDEYTSIEFLQKRYDNLETMNIEVEGDDVILEQKEPIHLENADS